MGTLKLKYSTGKFEEDPYSTLTLSDFAQFDPSLLGLGDIGQEGKYQQALSAYFDLEGFTEFCNQIDPHLVLPEFLKSFLEWLFGEIALEFTCGKDDSLVYVWCHLPFFSKFMGDGVLFLWDTSSLEQEELGNLVVSLHNVCDKYVKKFIPEIKKQVSKPPCRLRCGIARGQVVSVGDGYDFVGSCINVSSRIQKLGHFSFAFSRRGFTLDRCFSPSMAKLYELIKTQIRGVGDEELVFVSRKELEALTPEERKNYIF